MLSLRAQAHRAVLPPADALWSSVVSMLDFVEPDASTVFADRKRGTLWTPAGNAQVDTSAGPHALLCDGNGDYLTLPYSSDFDFDGDFCVECDVVFTGYSAGYGGNYNQALLSRYLAGAGNAGWQFVATGTSSSITGLSVYSGVTTYTFTQAMSLNTRYHLALSRAGSSVRAWINGTQAGSTQSNALSWTRATGSPLYLGKLNDGTFHYYLNGRMFGARITKGAARYTASFTAPSTPYPRT